MPRKIRNEDLNQSNKNRSVNKIYAKKMEMDRPQIEEVSRMLYRSISKLESETLWRPYVLPHKNQMRISFDRCQLGSNLINFLVYFVCPFTLQYVLKLIQIMYKNRLNSRLRLIRYVHQYESLLLCIPTKQHPQFFKIVPQQIIINTKKNVNLLKTYGRSARRCIACKQQPSAFPAAVVLLQKKPPPHTLAGTFPLYIWSWQPCTSLCLLYIYILLIRFVVCIL